MGFQSSINNMMGSVRNSVGIVQGLKEERAQTEEQRRLNATNTVRAKIENRMAQNASLWKTAEAEAPNTYGSNINVPMGNTINLGSAQITRIKDFRQVLDDGEV